jgi:CubicO group peptidase (beta-lactamase class C family)
MSSTRVSAPPRFTRTARRYLAVLAFAVALVASPALQAEDAGTARVDAEAPAALREGIEHLVADALAQAKLPGCVVAIGRQSGIVFTRAFGFRSLSPDKEPMTEDTVFDLASLTKPIATATSLMVLADQGKIDLDDAASRYVPEFAARGKRAITIRQLLTHVSGLPSETPVDD